MKYCPLAFGTLQKCLKNSCALYIDSCYGGECAFRAIGVNALEQTLYRNMDSWTQLPDLPDYVFPKEQKQEKESVASND